MLPTGFRTFHFVSFLYFFSFLFFFFCFVSFLTILFSFFLRFVFFFVSLRYFSPCFLFVFFLSVSFRFFSFFFPFLSLQVPVFTTQPVQSKFPTYFMNVTVEIETVLGACDIHRFNRNYSIRNNGWSKRSSFYDNLLMPFPYLLQMLRGLHPVLPVCILSFLKS